MCGVKMQLRVKRGYKIHIGRHCFCAGEVIPRAVLSLSSARILLTAGQIEQIDIDAIDIAVIERLDDED